MTLVEPTSKRLNIGATVLAIVKSRDNKGAYTDEITQSLLKLQEKFELAPISTRPGPTGLDSDRVRSLIGVFLVRGFLQEDSPAKITEEGERWMKNELKSYFKDDSRLESFWKFVRATT